MFIAEVTSKGKQGKTYSSILLRGSYRRGFTEDDLSANGAWLEGRHSVIERRLDERRGGWLR